MARTAIELIYYSRLLNNPFTGVHPSLGPFQEALGSKVAIIISVVWAGAFIFCAIHLIQAVAGFASARKHQRVDANEKGWAVATPAGAIIVLSVVAVVYAALAS